MQVLRGQVIGGWRTALSTLAQRAAITVIARRHHVKPTAASVLKEIVPNIGGHFGLMRCPTAPPLEGKRRQARLVETIASLFQRQTKPLLLLLEDLHWASESLAPLRQILKLMPRMRLLVVCTYRNDERPNLPDELPRVANHDLAAL